MFQTTKNSWLSSEILYWLFFGNSLHLLKVEITVTEWTNPSGPSRTHQKIAPLEYENASNIEMLNLKFLNTKLHKRLRGL